MMPTRLTAMLSLVFFILCVGTHAAVYNRSVDRLPSGWTRVGRPHPAHEIDITIAVSRTNTHTLHATFEALAVPTSPQYGQWLTPAQLRARFGHSDAAHAAVSAWLSGIGATSVQWVGDYVRARAPASALTPAPGHVFEEFERAEDGFRVVRCQGGVVLPDDVAKHVDTVRGLIDFLPPPSSTVAGVRPVVLPPPSGSTTDDADTPYPSPVPVQAYGGNHHITFAFFPECNGIGCTQANLDKLVKGFNIGFRAPGSSSPASSTIFVAESDAICTTTYGMLVCGAGVAVPNFQVREIGVANVFQDGTASAMSWLANATVAAVPWASPANIKTRYGVGNMSSPPNPTVSSGVVLFGKQYASLDSLHSYLSLFGEPMSSTSIVAPVNPNNASNPGDEGQMDIELITSMARGVPSTFWYSTDAMDGFFVWTEQMLNSTDDGTATPKVWSCSFGIPESQYDTHNGAGMMERVNEDLAMLGARGFTIVMASGDAGATNIGRGVDSCDQLQPSFPASSPYVVAVSATRFDGPVTPVPATPGLTSPPFCRSTVFDKPVRCDALPEDVTEVAVSGQDTGVFWTTGGGFSNRWPMPSWQAAAVNAYITKNPNDLPPAAMFNKSNRAYPDVSAVGASVPVLITHALSNSGGTSSSAPFFAGMLALLSNKLGKNLGPVGPLLYTHEAAFWDITQGNNACGEMECCPHGYSSTKGWDAVTGLGTLRFDKLLAALQSM